MSRVLEAASARPPLVDVAFEEHMTLSHRIGLVIVVCLIIFVTCVDVYAIVEAFK